MYPELPLSFIKKIPTLLLQFSCMTTFPVNKTSTYIHAHIYKQTYTCTNTGTSPIQPYTPYFLRPLWCIWLWDYWILAEHHHHFTKMKKMVGSESVKCAILSTLGASFIGSIISGNAVLKQAMLQSLLSGTKCTPDGFVTKVAE